MKARKLKLVITVPLSAVDSLTASMANDLSELVVLGPFAAQGQSQFYGTQYPDQAPIKYDAQGNPVHVTNSMIGADAVLKFGSVTKTVRVKLGLQGMQAGWNYDHHYHDHCLPVDPIDPIDPVDPPIDTKPIAPETLYFAFDESGLNEQSLGRLDELVSKVNKGTDIVTVKSYADSRGSASYNVTLSQKRAKAIADYLIRKGVNPAKIRTLGLGASQAFNTNKGDKEADYTANRRAMVSVVRSR